MLVKTFCDYFRSQKGVPVQDDREESETWAQIPTCPLCYHVALAVASLP